jgi:hypothetical protein
MFKRLVPAVLVFGLLASCGRKAPPFLPVPLSPGRLSVSDVASDGERILITVRVPRERFSLRAEEEPWVLARILRGTPEGEGKDFQEQSVLVDDEGFAFGKKIVLVDSDVKEGEQYLYLVELRKEKSKEWPASEPMAVKAIASPDKPESLGLDPREAAIVLSWAPPRKGVEGVEYRIFRREGKSDESLIRDGVRNNTYTDTRVKPEMEYCYRVVAVRRAEGIAAEGSSTPAVCGSTEDRSPPPPPSDLAAVTVEEGVRLTWLPGGGEKLSGYNIYRADGTGPFVKVNSEPVRQARYLDVSVGRGRRYSYRVSALDSSRSRNESPFSKVVTVAVPP